MGGTHPSWLANGANDAGSFYPETGSAINGTTELYINDVAASGGEGWNSYFLTRVGTAPFVLNVADSAGRVSTFTVASIADEGGGYVRVNVVFRNGYEGDWNGVYQLVLTPVASGSEMSLPCWTYQAGGATNPSSGLFTANNDEIGAITTLYFSASMGGSNINSLLSALPYSSPAAFALILTNVATGYSASFAITAHSFDSVDQLTVSAVCSGDNNVLSGEYTMSFAPYAQKLSTVLAQSSITPAGDGTYALPTSITISNGIITAIS